MVNALQKMEEFIAHFVKVDPLTVNNLTFKKELVMEFSHHLYLVNKDMQSIIKTSNSKPFGVGLFLGRIDHDQFVPSFYLLEQIAKITDQKVVIDDKSAWLFVCGRDIFRESANTNLQANTIVIVENIEHECLGYGKVVKDPTVIVKNFFDRGDFLSRERQR